MSYEIIKSIKVKDNKVYINCASNNVYPRYFSEFECTSLTNILQEKGQEALDVEILKDYESGNFQRGNNRYTRALKVLRHFPEYHKFDWRNNWEESKKNEGSKEYIELLKRALVTRLPKDKFIVTKPYGSINIYLYKITKKYAKWKAEKERAKIFRYKIDAENVKQWFTNSENWAVEKIK